MTPLHRTISTTVLRSLHVSRGHNAIACRCCQTSTSYAMKSLRLCMCFGREIADLRWLTSFLMRTRGFANAGLPTTHQPDNTSWLEEQKKNDQQPVNQGIQIAATQATGTGGRRKQREVIDHLGKPEDKSRTQNRAPRAGDAADNDRGDKLNGEREVPISGSHVTVIRGEERAGNARQERGENKRSHLRLEEIDAHNRRADLVIAHRPEGPSRARTHHVSDKEHREHQHQQDQQEVLLASSQSKPQEGVCLVKAGAANGRCWKGASLRAAG